MFQGSHKGVAGFVLAVLAAACGGNAPGPGPGQAPDPSDARGRFSSARVLSDVEALRAIGPRRSGSAGALAARRQIRAGLEAARIPVESVQTEVAVDGVEEVLEFEHLLATLPGASSDRFLLVAAYDTGDAVHPSPGEDASGAALLVELARVLAQRDFPYTLQFLWVEGEGPPPTGPEVLRKQARLGSRSLAVDWMSEGKLDGIRLLLTVNRVCDAELEIARDLHSHRQHRQALFQAARSLGRDQAFPRDSSYVSVMSSHRAFRALGLRPVVAIEDASSQPQPAADRGEGEPPAGSEAPAPAACSESSLETVGVVILETLDQIGARLAKIDRFSRVPAVESVEARQAESSQTADTGTAVEVPSEPNGTAAAP